VIVALSLTIAGAALLSGTKSRLLVGDDASLLKLFSGVVFLVPIAIFFQLQMQMSRSRRDLDCHRRQATGELDRMIGALQERPVTDAPSPRK
jgi:hypothetical protein